MKHRKWTREGAVSASVDLGDLVFLSLEPWDAIWRRNQFVCAALASRHPEMKILFVPPAHDVSNRLRRGDFRGMFQPSAAARSECLNIHFGRPLKFMPNTLASGRVANRTLLRNHVRKMMMRLRLQHPVLWINDHAAHHLVGTLGESAVIYDITDDWTSLSQSPRLTALIREQDEALCEKADAIIVCSQRLYEMKSRFVEKLHLVPNGVDAEHYATVADRSLPVAPPAAGWKRPVFGYTGTIHPDRVDVPLLQHLAAALPQATFAMVGPNHLPAPTMQQFEKCPNVVFTGPVPYHDIPDYMRAFDVCMTPHRMTAFTESLNPIKLWEYLAAGKPIVSTDVAGFRDYPHYVRIASTPESFAAALVASLDEPAAMGESRREEARRHSWKSRVDKIESIIESTLASRKRPPVHV